MRSRLWLIVLGPVLVSIMADHPQAQITAGGRTGQTATLVGTVRGMGDSRVVVVRGDGSMAQRPELTGQTVVLMTIANAIVYETTLDEDQAFAFRDIRAGQYIVALKRERHNVELGRVLLVTGATVDRDYTKGVVATGRVRDERGTPVPLVNVCLLRRRSANGNEQFVPAASTRTNARGQFLIGERLNLTAGEYIAAVMPAGCGVSHTPDDDAQHLLKYPPTYFPSEARPENATPMALVPQVDEEIEITMRPGPVTRLEGRLLGYVNTAVVPGLVILEPPEGAVSIVTTTPVDRNGRFTFAGLTPGRYRILSAPRKGPDPPRWGEQRVELKGEQVARVAVPLQPTAGIGGTIEFAGHLNALYGTRIFLNVAAIRMGERASTAALLPAAYDAVGTDGRFGITGVMPGRYRLDVYGAEIIGWHKNAALLPSLGPRLTPPDAFDVPFEVARGQSVMGIQISMTYRTTVISGQIQDAEGRPAVGTVALVFAADARYWTQRSRRVAVAAADLDGRFQISGLPEGDYLAIPVPVGVELPNPQLLESLRDAAVPLPLGDGERREVTLHVRELPSNCHACPSKQASGRGRNQDIIFGVYPLTDPADWWTVQ